MNMLTRQGHLIEEQGFMQRLAALVPRPRLHLLRFHGVLAPNAKVRAALVPGTAENPSERACEHTQRPARMSWARLLKRVFDHSINCTSPYRSDRCCSNYSPVSSAVRASA